MIHLYDLTDEQLGWLIWTIGVLPSYFMCRTCNRNFASNSGWMTYNYSHVFGNIMAGAASWLLFILMSIIWLCNNNARSTPFKEPPSWL